MNNNYFQKNTSSKPILTLNRNDQSYSGQAQNIASTPIGNVPPRFLENNFSINLGREVTIHMSFPDSYQQRDRSFHGEIAEVSRDHIVINDKRTNTWYFLPLVYLDYAQMQEQPALFAQDGSIK